ncbi:54972480-6805-4e86-bfcf-556afeef201f [Thermothielavioides terrestris]|uniref:54972480-6805-4e86-bfcf-556afeef201f n=1 Tax=Thermothielavioides terrestris TaxID=2587410 RepID=A0A446B8W7_9PEZI|nr:54972480-6805-4e86-bfcf-556afeef201f [Thermothielavioides terrestris]
MNLGANFHY